MRAVELLSVGPSRVTRGVRSGQAVRWDEPRAFDGRDHLAAAITDCFAHEPCGNERPVDVALASCTVQVRTLRALPPVPAPELTGLIEYQRDRFFRHTREEVLLSAAWLARAEGVARAALVERVLLEAIESGLGEAGRFADSIAVEPAEEERPAEPRLEFVTTDIGRRRRATRWRHLTIATLLAGIGWGVAGSTYLVDLVRDRGALEAEWAVLDASLARMDRVEEQLERYAPLATALARQGPGGAWLSSRLDEVSRALPDSVHVLVLSAERGGPTSVELHGPDAVAAVAAFEKLRLGAPRLLAPPTVDDERGETVQRFTVMLEPRS